MVPICSQLGPAGPESPPGLRQTPHTVPNTLRAAAVEECLHSFAKGQLVWYTYPDGRCVSATVVHIDVSIQPPSYGVQLGEDVGSYRETEARRCTDSNGILVLLLRPKQRRVESPHEKQAACHRLQQPGMRPDLII